MVVLSKYNGQRKTLLAIDRIRGVNYNGEEIFMNVFNCSDCKSGYYFEEINHKFCPFCGIEYEFKFDISI
jgi:hypothetical protein